MTNEGIIIKHDVLVDFMNRVFIECGVPEKDAKICSDVLIASDLQGIESHGVQRLKMYYDRIKANIQSPITEITIEQESPTTARLDGGHGMGHVAAHYAMKLAIKKAKEFGTGAVAVGNSTHFGITGYYSQMAIDEDMIGIACTNARPSIAPTFGVEPMMGTNPISIGIPTDEDIPFLFDAATSITQRGKVEVKARTKSPLPEGWVISEDGSMPTDSVQILGNLISGTNALLPLGGAGELLAGYKGYGLAAAVEIFSSAFSNGPFMRDLTLDKGYKLGHFFFAMDIDKIIPVDIFKKIAGNIVRDLRGSKKAAGQPRIYTAGEKEYEMVIEREKLGIPVNMSILSDLKIMRKELGLNSFSFT
ncbi:MAG: Ldh family oxidoreductase [Candidatus Hodarchaeales archaeon]|jgi:LDH2 family malate/lactate/ureidoglycolate dehydrogenase